MKQITALLKIDLSKKPTFDFICRTVLPCELANLGSDNISVWAINDLAFIYCELADSINPELSLPEFEYAVFDIAKWIARPGQMRLMYKNMGIPRQDKALIRHRVFATVLKPGCANEYKKRHDALANDKTGDPVDGRESNFTIWNADNYIFGYCELVKKYDLPLSEQETENTISWERRQLEIMDWLTDDVDWITGQLHPHIERIYPTV